jgi:hypothetical protein
MISLVENIEEKLLPATIITEAKEWVSGVDFDDFSFVAMAN